MAVGTSAGKTFIRPDGREKVTGVGRYTADLGSTGMAHAAFRYADHPHAKILRIDTTKARALTGVVAVITQDDLPDVRFGGSCRTAPCSRRTSCGSRARSWQGWPR